MHIYIFLDLIRLYNSLYFFGKHEIKHLYNRYL